MLNFFDPSFKEFSAPGLIKVYYGLSVMLVLVGWVVLVLAGFNIRFLIGAVALAFGPLLAFFLLLGTRLVCELILATVQTAQNTETLVQLMAAGSKGGLPAGGMADNGPLQRFLAAPPQPPA